MAGNRGGARIGAGRKPKADEIELIEKLKPLDDMAFNELQKGLLTGDAAFLKLFMAYRFGQPKQIIDANISGSVESYKPVWLNQEVITTTNGVLKES